MRIYQKRTGRTRDEERRDVAVFSTLCRLLAQWRYDPEKLAIAVWAYEKVLGYACAAWEVEYSHPDVPMISQEEALGLVNNALFGRTRRTLQHRAEGLVLALQALAEDVEAKRLHDMQVGAAIIECRLLSLEERLVKLRSMNDR